MTRITIENLQESRELDRETVAGLKGGIDIGSYVETMLMSVEIDEYSIGGSSVTNIASNGSVAAMSGLNITDVIGSINFTVVDA